MWTGLRLPRINIKLGIHGLRKLRTCDYRHKECIFPAGPITPCLTLRQRHVVRRVSEGLNCRREARKRFAVIVTFRMCSKNSPVLQHMLKILPSWSDALSRTARRRYLLSGVLPPETVEMSRRILSLSSFRVCGFVLYAIFFKLPHKLKSQLV